MRLVPAWSSGVMTLSAIVPLGVRGLVLSLPAVGNDNFVCRLPFVSLSFTGGNLHLLALFSPTR
jgi:hypothetical protein